jgi:two-component system response regulator YesN
MMGLYKAMFVDDEYMILEGLKMIIPWEELGFEVVHTAKSASEALAYLETQPIDLLITDIRMPEMNGIDMIAQAQAKGTTFFSIILSGYQEFAFVKQGMQLGVRNYLVKPVNKVELYESVQAIAKELAQQQRMDEQTDLYRESSLLLWLNDELNESEYQLLLDQASRPIQPPYTVLQLTGTKETLTCGSQFFLDKGQPLLLPERLGENQLLVIFTGERQQLWYALKELPTVLADDWQLIVSETITEWENVYKGYEKIKQVQSLQNFYPDLLINKQIIQVDILDRNEELPFLSFNKALTIGDTKTVQDELAKIFSRLESLQVDPEHVRYVAFLLFTDIYRQFPALTKENYDRIISQIRGSNTIQILRELFQEILQLAKDQPQQKRYSETVQKAVRMIEDNYTQELTVKSAAESLHVSVVYLGQLFKKETELSFNQYVNFIRIKKAQQLLLHTGKTINEIANAIGYNNTNYFSKMFKKLNGLTPKEFREKYEHGYESLD